MGRVLIADPAIPFPGFEQGIEIGRCQNENSTGSGYTSDFGNCFFRVGEMFHNMLDDDYIKRMICKRKFFRAGSLQSAFIYNGFRLLNSPVVQIHAIGFKQIFELTDQVSHP